MKKILSVFTLIISVCFSSFAQINESITFESNTPNLYMDSVTGVWQIGTPSKTIFNSAYSAPLALVTDTLNSYSDNLNDAAYFTVKLPAFYVGVNLSFKYKIDTDLNNDYGVLEILDNNNNWVNALNDNLGPHVDNIMFSSINISITDFSNLIYDNGIRKFTGTNNNWLTISMFICQFVALTGPHNDSTTHRGGGDIEFHFRFRFVSDNIITGKEGWMIDNINVIENISFCVSSLNENNIDNLFTVYPNPSTGIFNINIEDVPSIKQNVQCKVYDIAGKELYNSPLLRIGTGAELNLSHLQNGIYLLQLTNGEQSFTQKIVIQK